MIMKCELVKHKYIKITFKSNQNGGNYYSYVAWYTTNQDVNLIGTYHLF